MASDVSLALDGGNPACQVKWPSWPVHDQAEESAVLEVLRSGKWWFGEQVKRFEQAWAQWQGAKHAISCTNGTTALEAALRALGVVPGDEVIVPAYTFVATASAVVNVGAIPVFADIDPHTLCMDVADAASKLTSRTRAVVPVHVGGRLADMTAIGQLADQHGLVVLEDAAHAWGSKWRGRGAGTFGGCGTFSFQVSKNITCGEGGVIVTDHDEIAELCHSYTNCGRTADGAWYDHDNLGSNQRLTEFQAAILLAQLTRADAQLERRQQSVDLLDAGLAQISGITLLAPDPDMTRRSHHLYAFRLDEPLAGYRDRVLSALQAEGVPCLAGWYRPLYQNGLFQKAHLPQRHGVRNPLAGMGADYRQVDCPVCEQVCRDTVWLPQHVLLGSDADIGMAIDAIVKVMHWVRQA